MAVVVPDAERLAALDGSGITLIGFGGGHAGAEGIKVCHAGF